MHSSKQQKHVHMKPASKHRKMQINKQNTKERKSKVTETN